MFLLIRYSGSLSKMHVSTKKWCPYSLLSLNDNPHLTRALIEGYKIVLKKDLNMCLYCQDAYRSSD